MNKTAIHPQSLPRGYRLQGKENEYFIDQTLGQGAFGITYLAKYKAQIQGQMGAGTAWTWVCIKEFFMRELSSREEQTGSLHEATGNSLVSRYRKAFLREANNLARMQHPNIVNVFEVIEANNTAYIVMEYIDGGNLDDYIARKGHLSEDEAFRLFQPICDAMNYMHAQRMLHLDLKPKNVMLDEEGKPYLIDFGLSKQYTLDGEPESSTSIGLGTPGYAPSEQAEQRDGDNSFRATIDVYALGGTLYKMLTGETPPKASEILNDDELLSTKLHEAGVNDKLIKVFEKSMMPASRKRYQSVAELMTALEWTVKAYESTTASLSAGKRIPAESEETVTIDEDSHFINEKPQQKVQPNPTPQPSPAPNPTPKWLIPVLAGVVALVITFLSLRSCRKDEHVEREQEVVVEVVDYGSLKVTSTPTEAAVVLDGKEQIGRTPLIVERLALGNHDISVSLEGYEPLTKSVTIVAGNNPDLSFTLKECTSAQVVEEVRCGSLKVTSEPSGATIYVDGKRLAGKTTPELLENLTLGSHKIRLVSEGYEEQTKTVTIKEGRNTDLSVTLKAKSAAQPVQSNNSTDYENENIESEYVLHTVSAGQSLYSISKLYNVSVDEIITHNPSCKERSLKAGEKLKIPRKKANDPVAQPSKQMSQQASSSKTSTHNGHEYVDLGLSVMWATCNVGASSPSAYGNYYAWGETTTKSDYSWETLRYCNDKRGVSFSKYVTQSKYGTVDNKKVLEPSDDAARQNWGGSWRIPTDAEWTELRTKCSWTWTRQGGHDGYNVTSKSNGNAIFLPAAGHRNEMRLDAASDGFYWSSSLDADAPNSAWDAGFGSLGLFRFGSYRSCGQSIRPVCRP